MTGKIIKGIAGFYYINDGRNHVYQCKAKGVFRNRKIKPLVGDNVEFSVLDEEEKEGNIDAILPRSNVLIRPAVAGQCGPGYGGVFHHPSGAQFKPSGPLSGDDGNSGSAGHHLF